MYVETISNPLLEVPDLQAVVDFARRHGLVSIVDNTFASPINFRPAELGFDLSIHSATKYLNGHTDIVAGAVIGKRELVERITRKLNHLGGALDPHACFLLSRGMKTLAVRVRYQNESALKIARFLEQHPRVAKVNYPGLEGHTNHLRACELFDGFGGVLSFELAGGVEAAESFIANATHPDFGAESGRRRNAHDAAGNHLPRWDVSRGPGGGRNRRWAGAIVDWPRNDRRLDRGF